MNKLIEKFQTPSRGIKKNHVAKSNDSKTILQRSEEDAKKAKQFYESTVAATKENVKLIQKNRDAMLKTIDEAKRDRSVIKETPVPYISKQDLKRVYTENTNKQTALKNLGFYNMKVDGSWGNGSREAEKLALDLGYVWDGKNYVKKTTPALTVVQEGEGELTPLVFMNEDVTAEDLANYGHREHFTPIGSVYKYIHDYITDHVYPYSYGDVWVNKLGDVIPYRGELSMPGYTLKQTTGNYKAKDQLMSMGSKIWNGLTNNDPRVDLLAELRDLDLDTKEGMDRWNEIHRTYGTGSGNNLILWRTGGDPRYLQYLMRMRYDLDAMYKGRGMKYNTFMEETDPNNKNSHAGNKPTWVISNPEYRKRYNGELYNYWMSHDGLTDIKEITDWDGKKRYILQYMSPMGNAVMIADNRNGLNLRTDDDWDYLLDPSENLYNKPYIGDNVTRQPGVRTTGNNRRYMTETSPELLLNLYDQEVSPLITKAKDFVSNLISGIKLPINKNGGNIRLVKKGDKIQESTTKTNRGLTEETEKVTLNVSPENDSTFVYKSYLNDFRNNKGPLQIVNAKLIKKNGLDWVSKPTMPLNMLNDFVTNLRSRFVE